MSNQHSVIALDWLNPVLQKVFSDLNQMLVKRDPSKDMTPVLEHLHQVTGALRLINQLELSKLSAQLEAVSQAILAGKLPENHYMDVYHSVALLQYELQQLQQTQHLHHAWITDKTHYLENLLGVPVVTQSTFLEDIVLPAIAINTTHQDSVSAETLKVWRYNTLQLLEANENKPQYLQVLQTVALYLASTTSYANYTKLWQIASQWLDSLCHNQQPLPQTYATLLSELDTAIPNPSLSNFYLAKLAIDILLHSALLEYKTDTLQTILTPLHLGTLDTNPTLFQQVLTRLEQAIFQLATPSRVLPLLQDIRSMLSHRGWQFYENHLTQIISDIQMMIDEPSSADMLSWQVERQMQDLYSQLMQTADTLENQVGMGQFSYAQDPNQEALRQTRIHLENIKLSFNDYIQTRRIEALAVNDELTGMSQVFDILGLERPKILAEQLRVLFGQLISHNIDTISWETSDVLADMIAQFELFLDYLSHQQVNDDLLENTQQLLSQATSLVATQIQQPLTASQVASRDKHYAHTTSVYDDKGETIIDVTPNRTEDEATIAIEAPVINTPLADSVTPEDFITATPNTDTSLTDTSATLATDGLHSEAIAPALVETTEGLLEGTAHLQATENLDTGESDALQQARTLLKPDEDSMDDDIREIFIEEAEEVLTEMATSLSIWQEDSQDLATLKDIRRGFHTLKGSGRMVGAFQIGETAWAVENLLNRVLDNTVPVSAELVTFIQSTHAQLPQLVTDFAHRQSPSIDPALIVLQATNLIQQQPLNQGMPTVHTALAPAHSDDFEGSLSIPTASHPTDESSIANAEVTTTPTTSTVVLPATLQQAIDSLEWKADDIMDEDIQDIYVEEAVEVLEEITPLYQQWRTDTSDTATLKEIRRGFHTLKGSGRMVGANQLGELGWAIENMLNRVLDNAIEANSNVVALLGDVIDAFPSLVAIFAQSRDDYPATIRVWAALATLYSKKQGEDIDYLALSPLYTQNAATTLPDIPDSTLAPVMVEDIQALPEPEPSMEISDRNAMDDRVTDDHVIAQVFLEESQELLQKIDKFIAQHQGNSGNDNVTEVAIPDELVRVFHTLRGGAALSQLPRVYALSAALENGLDTLIRQEHTLTVEKLAVLVQARQLLTGYIEDYRQQRSVLAHADDDSTHEQLLAELMSDSHTQDTLTHHAISVTQLLALGIDDLLEADLYFTQNVATDDATQRQNYITELYTQAKRLDEAVEETKFAPLAHALKSAYRYLQQYPELSQDEALSKTLLQAHAQLTNVFDEIAAGMNIYWDESVTPQLSQLMAEKVYQTQLAHITYETVINDNELVEIFLDEVLALTDSFNLSFSQWQNNLTNTHAIKELQRYSNAVAGGARLVGIDSVYRLAEAAKTVYRAVINGTLDSSTDLVDVMQQVHDTLATQIQFIKQTSRGFYATDLEQQLLAIAQSGEVSRDILLAVPVLVTEASAETDIEQEIDTPVTASSDIELPQHSIEYSQDIINNFEQRRIQTWEGQEPDDDILQIYLEEAKELVDSSSQNLQEFRSNTNNLAALQALQRELHTIKGGARMVGAEGLATLAHEMETVYEELGSRRKPATRMIGNLLAACHDWLASALYVLENKYNPELPTPLVEALLQFSKNPDSLKVVPQASLANQIEQIKIYQSSLAAIEKGDKRDISVMPLQMGNFGEAQEQLNTNAEMIRVPANLMERMINLSGESAINRARIDMGVSSLTNTIEEMGVTVQRLADQLRRMETELEVQILSQIDDDLLQDAEFDPLEMDQYSSLNQLSKSLSESASDLLDIKTTMLDKTRDTENLLLQLSRTQLELQEGLMTSRTVPFSRITPRLQRIVRQTANELNKSVELRILNDEGEIDRNILERITSPLEHMLRNAVDHGIERTQERIENGKSRTGLITLEVEREGDEIVVYLTDDGKGINVDAVRKKAIEQGLIGADDTSLKPVDIMQYIFNAGLSTSTTITQISGRGVGMDVVQSEIKQLGGVVSVDSEAGKGSRFILRLPLTVAVSDALVVKAGDKNFAVPLVQIERVVRINAETVYQFYDSEAATIDIDGEAYRLRYLNQILYNTDPRESVRHQTASVPVIIIRNETGQKLALQVDALAGSRVEVVVKPLGKQLSHISGISAATIMGDGSVMLILDLNALMRNAIYTAATTQQKMATTTRTTKPVVLIIDDSVTVRKVTSRLLERHGYDTQVAKDGIDALEKLQDLTPDIMLLDIEMPRMDGFEVATQVRHNSRLKQVPIIMITSRTGEKHRERALSIGVNEYMGKPFQEQELVDTITQLLSAKLSS